MILIKNKVYIPSLIISLCIVLVLFAWQGNKGFHFGDEGYYWYGVQRVILGEVPILDFSSYDPGRYYWAAIVSSLMNENGIMTARFSAVIFQIIGLFVGVLLIAKNQRNINGFYLIVSAIILVLWMQPYYKSFDFTASILLIASLALVVNNPTCLSYFFAGIGIGLMAYFGRNHGVYGVIGTIGVLLWINITNTEEIRTKLINGFLMLLSGVIVGYLPMIFMIFFIPNFADAFWDKLLGLFVIKSTNVARPIPWPWLVKFESGWFFGDVREFLIGLFFIGVLAFPIIGICCVFWQRIHFKQTSPVLVSSSFLALPYAHYSYSRADLYHLSLGIFPLLIGILSLLSSQPFKTKWLIVCILSVCSLWVMRESHPGWNCHTTKCVEYRFAKDTLLIKPWMADRFSLLQKLVDQYAPNDESFFAGPVWPDAYAAIERKSPVHGIYMLFPSTPESEQKEIERLKSAKIGFALIDDHGYDDREEMRFSINKPLIYSYFKNNFDHVNLESHSRYQLYIPKRDKN